MASYEFEPDVMRYEIGPHAGDPILNGDGLPMLDPDSEFYVLRELEAVVRKSIWKPDVVSVCEFEALSKETHLEIIVSGFQMYFRNGDPPERDVFQHTIKVNQHIRHNLSESTIAAVGLIGQYNTMRERQEQPA